MPTNHPSAPDDLFTGLWQAAHWIWDRRKVAIGMGMPFSEETITETVLLDLAASFPGQISILPFNKVQEGKVGADWEWCFYDEEAGRYLRMLIQAKVLDDKEIKYSHLDRMVGNTGVRQVDLLEATSADRGVPAYFVFYNYISDPGRLSKPVCSCVGECNPCWGATIAPIEAVLTNPLDKTFDSLAGVMQPWACLICPSQESSSSPALIDRVFEGIQFMQLRAGFARVDRGFREFRRAQIEDVPPSYLRRAMSTSGRDFPKADSNLRRELAAENPQLDGLVLIDAGALDRIRAEDASRD